MRPFLLIVCVAALLSACSGANRDLRLAVQSNDLQAANALLKAGADPNAADSQGRTPLFLAVQQGYLDGAKFLVAHGAKIGIADRESATPLHCAAEWGQPALVRFLLASGADASAKDAYGHTPAQAVCDKWNFSIPKLAADPSIEGLESTMRAGFNAPPNCPKEQLLALLSPGAAKEVFVQKDGPAPAAMSPAFRKPGRPDDFAVVAGVSRYQGKDIPPAPFADGDAQSVVRYLRALGVPEDHIQLLTNDQATSARLKGYLESWLPKNVKPSSRVYFYFAGHGSSDPVTRAAYLVPWDGDPNYLEDSGARLTSVYSALGNLAAEQVIVMLDSCFSGGGGRSIGSPGARPLVSVQTGGDLPPHVSLFAATQADEITYALPDQGHGIFTYYWLKALDAGLSDSPALCAFLQDKVSAAAALQNGVQRPVCSGPKVRF